MTKLRWDKADRYGQDPGTAVDVPEPTRPSRWVPPQERARRVAERAKEKRELKERSEQHDWDLMEAQLEARIREKEALGVSLLWLEKQFLKRREERR